MATENIKIKDLPETTEIENTDVLVVDNGSETEKITRENFVRSITPEEIGIGNVFNLKGSKATYGDLPNTGNHLGDVWFVENEHVGYVWLKDIYDVERWEQLGLPIDLTNYVLKTYFATLNRLGLVKPDGTSIIIDNDGTIHAAASSPPDQSYNPISSNAQSGIAVNQALGGLLFLPLTRDEYDAITTKSPNTLYIIIKEITVTVQLVCGVRTTTMTIKNSEGTTLLTLSGRSTTKTGTFKIRYGTGIQGTLQMTYASSYKWEADGVQFATTASMTYTNTTADFTLKGTVA